MTILTTNPDGPECPLSPFAPGGPCNDGINNFSLWEEIPLIM
jgi:hypothetical protein